MTGSREILMWLTEARPSPSSPDFLGSACQLFCIKREWLRGGFRSPRPYTSLRGFHGSNCQRQPTPIRQMWKRKRKKEKQFFFVNFCFRLWSEAGADRNLPQPKFTSYKYKTLHTQYGELLVKSLSLFFIPKYKQIHCRLSRSYGTKKRVHIELTYRHISFVGTAARVTLHLSLLHRRYPGGPGQYRG